MKFEQQICKKCSHVNPLYSSICINCKSYLRDRVVNIDLWQTLARLIEEPSRAFRGIIYAENKNFIFFFLFFIAVKNLIYTRFFSTAFLGRDGITSSFFISFLFIIALTPGLQAVYSLIMKAIYKKFSMPLRFKDVFAVNIYSLTPFIISLFTIFIVEMVVFGADLFSNNPYAFQIKPTIAWILAGLEILVLVWTVFLLSVSSYSIIKKKLISFFLSVLFIIFHMTFLAIFSHFIFTL